MDHRDASTAPARNPEWRGHDRGCRSVQNRCRSADREFGPKHFRAEVFPNPTPARTPPRTGRERQQDKIGKKQQLQVCEANLTLLCSRDCVHETVFTNLARTLPTSV